jgi:hypothetical protein
LNNTPPARRPAASSLGAGGAALFLRLPIAAVWRAFSIGFNELLAVPRAFGMGHRLDSGSAASTFHNLKPRLAESFVEAGKDVAVIPFGPDFVFPVLDQNVGLQGVVDAADDHHARSLSA